MTAMTAKSYQKLLGASLGFLLAFAGWTAAVCCMDVQPIGPNHSRVGFATMNAFVHRVIGVHLALYTLTDWLSLAAIALMLGFAGLGLWQWFCRKSFWKVDKSLVFLGGFYLAVLGFYLFFEAAKINFRPVLIEGVLEASYPSSTTLLILCTVPTAILQLHGRIRAKLPRRTVCAGLGAFAVFMVAGRLVSGVHWCSDIIGGILLSAGLVLLYAALCRRFS